MTDLNVLPKGKLRRPFVLRDPVWEKQKGETQKAFAAFVLYRDMPQTVDPATNKPYGDRSSHRVAVRLSKSDTLIRRWSARYHWLNRTDAYDTDQDRKKLRQVDEERESMLRRHLDISILGQQRVAEALREMSDGQLKARDVPRFFDIFAKHERLSRGEATTIVRRDDNPEEDRAEKMRRRAIAALKDSEELFPGKSLEERAASIAAAFHVKISDLIPAMPTSESTGVN